MDNLFKQNAKLDECKTHTQAKSAWKVILGGLLINLSNPKIVIFFSSVLAGYVTNLSNLTDILTVLLILTGSALVYFILISLLFSQRRIRQFYAKHNRYLDNFAGIVFILFGLKLVYDGFHVFL